MDSGRSSYGKTDLSKDGEKVELKLKGLDEVGIRFDQA